MALMGSVSACYGEGVSTENESVAVVRRGRGPVPGKRTQSSYVKATV